MLHDNNGNSNGPKGQHHLPHDDGNVIRFEKREKAKPQSQHPPMINLPPFTKALIAVIIVVHALVWTIGLVSEPLHDKIYEVGAFTSASWSGGLPFMWWTPLTIITFSFLHGGWLHLLINTVMLMAFGTGIEKWLGPKRMLILFLGSSVFALLCQFAAEPHSFNSVVGISGGISGFFGALLLMMQQERALGNKKNSILPFIAVWVVISVLFGYMGAPDGSPIAWLAHIGGFFGGLAISWQMLGRPNIFRPHQ